PLEVVYLMNVVKYLDSTETLKVFVQVNHHCLEAISRTKINPCYGINSLAVAISNSRYKNALFELKVFDGIETFYVDYNSLEKMSVKSLENIPLINVHKFVMQNGSSDYAIFRKLSDKICSIGIDTAYTFNPNFSNFINLREIVIRVGQNYNNNIIEQLFEQLPKFNYLHKVVIRCDSNRLHYLRELSKKLQIKTKVIFIIDWLHKEDIEEVNDLVNSTTQKVGIVMINFDDFEALFMKSNVVLLPFCPYNFQVSSKMTADPRFYELLKMYLPTRLEIQGGIRPDVEAPKNKIIDLSKCICLNELFMNEARYTSRIIVKLPTSLNRMFINNLGSIDSLEGIDETHLPDSLKEQFSQGNLFISN
ncbi:Hypothetical protein EHI5A_138890, partial [Entamoeba histolytica KU27]